MKKIFLLGAALGLALTVPQTPNAMGAEDKKESAFEWGYWNSGIAPAAGPVALNVDPNSAGTPDYRQDPLPQPLPQPLPPQDIIEPVLPVFELVRPPMPAQSAPVASATDTVTSSAISPSTAEPSSVASIPSAAVVVPTPMVTSIPPGAVEVPPPPVTSIPPGAPPIAPTPPVVMATPPPPPPVVTRTPAMPAMSAPAMPTISAPKMPTMPGPGA